MTDVEVRLTDLASCGGCAAKYSAARLEELLRGFVPVEAERLLVRLTPADDAAVYLLDDDRALVFTVNFFPPIVDDAGDYGTIAATNALNDVFAMGGAPQLALSIAAFPEELPSDVLARVSPRRPRRFVPPADCSRAVTRSATTSRNTAVLQRDALDGHPLPPPTRHSCPAIQVDIARPKAQP